MNFEIWRKDEEHKEGQLYLRLDEDEWTPNQLDLNVVDSDGNRLFQGTILAIRKDTLRVGICAGMNDIIPATYDENNRVEIIPI